MLFCEITNNVNTHFALFQCIKVLQKVQTFEKKSPVDNASIAKFNALFLSEKKTTQKRHSPFCRVIVMYKEETSLDVGGGGG